MLCTGGKDEANIETGIERMIADLRDWYRTWDLDQVEIEVQNMVATYALHYPKITMETINLPTNLSPVFLEN